MCWLSVIVVVLRHAHRGRWPWGGVVAKLRINDIPHRPGRSAG